MEYFKTQLGYIVHDDIREKTVKVLEAVNEKFFTAPASSTGKYHPEYALGEGGLYRHTVAAVKIAHDILQREFVSQHVDERTKDFIISALILHDVCKSGITWNSRYTIFEHPLIAVELIEEVIGKDDDFTNTVSNLISTHMGEWNTSKYATGNLPKPESHIQFFVHICDYLASRKYINIDLSEDEL